MQRTVFFISDGTAITTETLGHSLLTQFPDVQFKQMRIPFVSDSGKARDAVLKINAACQENGAPAIVILSIVDKVSRQIIKNSSAICLDLFADFIDTLEQALGVKRRATVGQVPLVRTQPVFRLRIRVVAPSVRYLLSELHIHQLA